MISCDPCFNRFLASHLDKMGYFCDEVSRILVRKGTFHTQM